jgi:hypothetical protein
MNDKLAEEILDKYDIPKNDWRFDIIAEAMQEYHKARLKEITDSDIEEWANGIANPESKKDFERGEWLGIKEGAKAFRDNKIKHIEK